MQKILAAIITSAVVAAMPVETWIKRREIRTYPATEK
jgi:hypothetical protein